MDFSINIHPALVAIFLATFIALRILHLERRYGAKKDK